MSLRIDLYVHMLSADTRLDEILSRLKTLQAGVTQMANELDALEAEAKANTDAEQAAVTLLGQLHDLLVAAQSSGDPARLNAVIASLGTSKDALAAAIVANTPAA